MKPGHPEQLRYQGCLTTPALWSGRTVSPFAQIDLPLEAAPLDPEVPFKNQRLGKLVEEFVFYQLGLRPTVIWIADSLQIQEGKRTVGELDALYYNQGTPVHLEIAYKFYLYDALENNPDPLGRWIGPNRKDKLSLKLHKLGNKQFPLLRSPLAKTYLEAFGLTSHDIEQRLCFKGQLYLPYGKQNMDVGPLNQDCVAGFHLSFRELERLEQCSFYLPKKLDWLVIPHSEVDWLDYSVAATHLREAVDQNRSPLVWLKYPDNSLRRCFVTYW